MELSLVLRCDFAPAWLCALNKVSQRRVLQDLCRRVTHVKKDLVQGSPLDIVLDQVP